MMRLIYAIGFLALALTATSPARADYAVVSGVDLRQDPVVVTGTGELARCLQHETDHLRGKLYIDDLTGPERRRVMRHLTAPTW